MTYFYSTSNIKCQLARLYASAKTYIFCSFKVKVYERKCPTKYLNVPFGQDLQVHMQNSF